METNNDIIDRFIKQANIFLDDNKTYIQEKQRIFQENQRLIQDIQKLLQDNQRIFHELERNMQGNNNILQNLNHDEILNNLEEVELNEQFKNKEDKCAICLEIFSIGDKVSYLPCFHFFHSSCIKNWIRIKNKCPFCNNIIKFS